MVSELASGTGIVIGNIERNSSRTSEARFPRSPRARSTEHMTTFTSSLERLSAAQALFYSGTGLDDGALLKVLGRMTPGRDG